MTRDNITVAVTGGIGSGKSVVSRILAAMGYEVYDCDRNARLLMDGSDEIKRLIADRISEDAIADGVIDRRKLGEIVFNDPMMLSRLNSIVHGAVRDHFTEYRKNHSGLIFFETAILSESGFDTLAQRVWEVIAPQELRIERVMKRNNLTRKEVEVRIASQSSTAAAHFHSSVDTIVNDGAMSLLQQVTKLLQNL
ncbi:MAG: dephospho-CoA kinase [Duncaniella sp.]|nr:dephospho-CoA kinase [Duncaniella sp.]